MKHVLYTHDMEPITVVEIGPYLTERLMRGDIVVLPALVPPRLDLQSEPPGTKPYLKAIITGEKFYRNGQTHLILLTKNEEAALALKAAFLPGQQGELNHRRDLAFAKGFMAALEAMG